MREDGINTRAFERGGRDYLRKVAILYLLNECHTASRLTIEDALHRLFTSPCVWNFRFKENMHRCEELERL